MAIFKRKTSAKMTLITDTKSDISEFRGRAGSFVSPGLFKEMQKDRKRIITKGGQCNVALNNVPSKKMQYYKDIFTTCVDMKWRYTFSAFVSAFFISWLIFTVLYYIVAIYRHCIAVACSNFQGFIARVAS